MADNDDIMDADPDQGDVARDVEDALALLDDIFASSDCDAKWTGWHQTSTEVAVSQLTPEQRQDVWEMLLERYNDNDDECNGHACLNEVRGVKKALFGKDAKVTIS